MKHKMLINTVHKEQKRMATVCVEDGKLIEYNIQMAMKEPIIGNVYKAVVLKVERGLQAAFVNFSPKRNGFLPLRDIPPSQFSEPNAKGKPTLKPGQTLLVQVVREMSERKRALLTGYISLPGRYVVLLPDKTSNGVSRKIENEEDRRRLKEMLTQIKTVEGSGFIIRTAGMNRTKQELTRDYQHLIRLWREIQKKAETAAAPTLIYQESDFGIQSIRDYLTPEVEEILVDDQETYRKIRSYCKVVAPRTLKMIKHYKDKIPIFEKYKLEDQIRVIYRERVELKSGGSIVITPTEALTTIDVNSGRGSHMRNVEETAFRANIEAAEEIARQLRLRDLGGLIVIDYIDMSDKKHIQEVEKTFKNAMSIDRSRIQLSRISKFGLLELSRQKKHSTIQEISYVNCPHCEGTGLRPSLEYTALTAYRRIESEVVKGTSSHCKVTLPQEVAAYLLNHKRHELVKLETEHDLTIHMTGVDNLVWDKIQIETTKRPQIEALPWEESADSEEEVPAQVPSAEVLDQETAPPAAEAAAGATTPSPAPPRRKSRRRPRYKKNIPADPFSGEAQEAREAQEETESLVSTESPSEMELLDPAAVPGDPSPEAPVSPAEPPRRKSRRRPRYKKSVSADPSSGEAQEATEPVIATESLSETEFLDPAAVPGDPPPETPASPAEPPRRKSRRRPRYKKSVSADPSSGEAQEATEPVIATESPLETELLDPAGIADDIASETAVSPAEPPRRKSRRRPWQRRKKTSDDKAAEAEATGEGQPPAVSETTPE